MKKLFMTLATVIISTAMLAGVAMALPTLDNYTGNAADAVYADTGADYVVLTDPVDPASAPMLKFFDNITGVNSGWTIGIFDINDPNEKLEVLNASIANENVIFNLGAGTATTTMGGNTANIGTTFGYYFAFGPLVTLYSDASLNTPGTLAGLDYFGIYHDELGIPSLTFAETAVVVDLAFLQGEIPNLPAAIGFSVDDVQPVPEPATMLLFGTGLVGLAGYRRKRNKKA